MSGIKGIHNTRGMKTRPKGGATKTKLDTLDRSHPNTMANHHDRWLNYLTQRNYSPNTVKLYDEANRAFLIWCEDRGVYTPKEVTKRLLESFQRYLYHYRKSDGSSLAVSTQRKRLGVLNRYFDYLCKIDYLTANPASSLDLPRKPKRQLPRALSRETITLLMSQFDITDPLGIRSRAIVELAYATGIRRKELTNLDTTDINYTSQTLLVRKGKGGKDRVVPIGHTAIYWLQQYLEKTRYRLVLNDQEKALFVTGYGTRYTAEYLSEWLSNTLKEMGIDFYGSFHLLRHSCATHLVENGADIKIVQQLLGHENLETTGIYTDVAIKHLSEAYHKTHPSSVGADTKSLPQKEE